MDYVISVQARLEQRGIESARAEALALVSHGLRTDRGYVLAHPFEEVIPTRLEPLIERRLAREPLAYILGFREFYGRRFNVDSRVLVPRQETETLVETALELMPEGKCKLLDLGTGSGCVAITLKLEQPNWEVWASDVSEGALEVAQANARSLGADVHFNHSNGFAGLGGELFDLIVTNPPYVTSDAVLQAEVRVWEPPEALFSGPTGLEFYWRLAQESAEFLAPGGLLLTEVGDGQADAVAEVLEALGWRSVSRKKDLIGHDRVLVLETPSTT